MKKIMFMLLGVAAAMNAMATAKVQLILTSESGYTSTLRLSQSDENGALTGSEMYEDTQSPNKVALYVLNGTTKLSIAKAADFTGVNVGVSLTTADTKYTISVKSAEGDETLYLTDGVNEYALTANASYDFAASAVAFTLAKKAAPAVPGICHQNGKLEITAYKGASVQVVEYDDNTKVAVPATDINLDYQEIDLANVAAGKQYVVIVTNGADVEKLVIKK